LVVLQDLTDLEKLQGSHSGELYPVSSHDTYQAISIKAENSSDAEDGEDLDPETFPVIETEPEVITSCMSMFSVFHKYGCFSFYSFDMLRVYSV
jgi:hypothetical protein